MGQKYDIAIIGAGPGGYVAAIRAAQLGFKTVCIDKGEKLGGTCLNVGCIPSKALLHTTEQYNQLLRHGAEQGIVYNDLKVNFSQMMTHKLQVVDGLVQGIAGLFKRHDVSYIQGTARFISSHLIEVTHGKDKQKIEASYFILSTGSEPISLPLFPFDETRIISSTGALSLVSIPNRLTVIGAGVIGVELASVYQRLGSQVTVIEMLDRICPAMDLSISKSLLQILKKQGLTFNLSTQVVNSIVTKEEITLQLNHKNQPTSLKTDVVLVAIGRRPFSDGLDLNKIGITLTDKGFVFVDSCFRTKHPHIFAIGDLIEGTMLAHRASEEGVCVVDFIKGHRPQLNYMAIPNVIYTLPEVASVGLTEEEARSAGLDIKIGSCSFKGNPRARCSLETDGFVKVIGESHSGRLIGMHIIGSHASELIAEGMLAIEKKVTLEEIAHSPNAHPTLSEAIKEAALVAIGTPIHS